ncbi:alpha/beta fold hydrolase [Geodermatophilus marinus]|uniref:alpha/beta fold hydrolase n=1 Tax=Geodermatophilus sp. LHW52908 TaxID=2303986 RepID=UPI000E3D18CD|nr:alpha/beta fold hydrolase [Geodermatophilus sp. LHW52908]RFU21985.1 alpha/beta hydrolase [Geodermatophilus sp. LHW52908]
MTETRAGAADPPAEPEAGFFPTAEAPDPPTLAGRAVASALAIGRVGLSEGWRYWSRLPRRGFPPLTVLADLGRWAAIVLDRRPPVWHSPNEVVWSTPIARLRDFTDGAGDDVVPTLLLPPQAGHDSCIVDFSPQQSQVRAARAAGLTALWSLDWIGATYETRDAGIEDHVAVVDRAVETLGGRVNLVGDCQGGWLSAIYAALHPAKVHTLTLAGAPIDTVIGAPQVGDWIGVLEAGDMAFYRALVASGGGVLPGRYQLGGFIALKPEAEVERQLQLLTHLDDPDHVARYREFEDWFKHTQDVAGAFYLWIVQHLFRDNELVRGELVVGGQRVDLARITCPLHLLGGATDHITPPAQVFAAAAHVGTPVADIRAATTAGGHLGLFMGTEALRDHWPVIFADVARRSRRDVGIAS